MSRRPLSARRPRRGCARAAVAATALILGLAAAAGAQQFDTRAHDTDQPIEIEADSLEVQQDNKLATFRGNVVARQGELRLRSEILRVHYREAEGTGERIDANISRIDAEGDVFISSPSETAQGEVGVYDVDNSVITLTGSVVLTRGENVIRGDRLEMDLATGRSEVKSVARDDGGEGRVKALFVPQSKSSE